MIKKSELQMRDEMVLLQGIVDEGGEDLGARLQASAGATALRWALDANAGEMSLSALIREASERTRAPADPEPEGTTVPVHHEPRTGAPNRYTSGSSPDDDRELAPA